jgi:hypothetical protein
MVFRIYYSKNKGNKFLLDKQFLLAKNKLCVKKLGQMLAKSEKTSNFAQNNIYYASSFHSYRW